MRTGYGTRVGPELEAERLFFAQLEQAEADPHQPEATRYLGRAVLSGEPAPLSERCTDVTELKRRAELTDVLLSQQLDLYEASCLSRVHSSYRHADLRDRDLQLISDAKEGRIGEKPPGLWLDANWNYDIVSALVENKPMTIWLEGALPMVTRVPLEARALWPDELTEEYAVSWHREGHAAFLTAKMLHAINPSHNARLRFVASGDGHFTSYSDEKVANMELELMEEVLTREGLLDPDTPNDSVKLVRLTDYVDKARTLVDQLAQSGAGEIMDDWGQLVFKTAPWLRRWTNLQYSPYEGVGEVGDSINLGPSGQYEPGRTLEFGAALHAAPYIESLEAGNGMQVSIKSLRNSSVGGVLRALDAIRRDDYHNIGMRAHYLGNEFRALQIAGLLRRELGRYIESFSRYVSFDDMDAEKYMKKNYYNQMKQDKEIIQVELEAEAEVIAALGIDFKDPATLLKDYEALHVCVGSNLYPVMLRQRLSSGVILGVDLAPSAKEYMDKVKQGYHAERWQIHEDEMVAQAYKQGMDGSKFRGAKEEAAHKLQVVVDDVGNLPKKAFRLIEMHFGAEATGLTRSNFYNLTRAVASALKDEGSVFEAVCTMDSRPWSDNENELPAVSMKEDDYDLAFIDAGFEIVEKRVIGADLPEDVKVRPDENFIYYRCKLRPGVRR
jgi:hypothetical protein